MENDLNKILYLNELFDFYGELISDKQSQIFIYYYQDNLSLSEISNNLKISKTGVYDALKKAENSLNYYENTLHLYKINHEKDKLIKELYLDKHIDEIAYKKLKGE